MVTKKQILIALALVLCFCAQLSLAQTRIPFPQSAITFLASRRMRYHHYMWHQVRANWNKFSSATKDAFKQIGWDCPNAARNYDSNGVATAVSDNYSGEDFLYMHRDMIRLTNEILWKNKEKYGNLTSWKTIPAPGDKDWPVPPTYTVTGDSSFTEFVNSKKTTSFFEKSMKSSEAFYKNPVELRKMTLSEMGSKMELAIHTWMHMRWSKASPVGYRPGSSRNVPNFDKKWDDPNYTWMGDVYASHVDEVFWKLHCWVDDRIEDWRKANGVTTIKWKGNWTGGPMDSLKNVTDLRAVGAMTGLRRGDPTTMEHDHTDSSTAGTNIEEAMRLFAESGVKEFSFADDVALPAPGTKWRK